MSISTRKNLQKSFEKISADKQLAIPNLSSNYKKKLEKLIGIVYNGRIWGKYVAHFSLPIKI